MYRDDQPTVERICLPSKGGCGRNFMVPQESQHDLCNNGAAKNIQAIRRMSNEVGSPVAPPFGSDLPEKG